MLLIKKLQSKLTSYYLKYNADDNLENKEVTQSSIIVYVSGGIDNYYQFIHWVDPLQELNKKYKITVATRNALLYLKIKKSKLFPTVWLSSLNQLLNFYDKNSFPIILYVNNAQSNFQSLIYAKGYHIHLNHGESEKESMYSNQSKAYDYVLCAGERAVERYREALLNFDEKKYIPIGRPQLDFVAPYNLNKENNQKVILYAPTWEGHHETMDYCSIEKYGVLLIEKLLSETDHIILYKPHPNTGTRRSDVKKAHHKIMRSLKNHINGKVITDVDINSVFTAVDFTFFDNSSVMIDYLHHDKAAFFFEIRSDESLRFLTQCFDAVTESTFDSIIEQLEMELKNDSKKNKRQRIKEFYLGNYASGESVNLFISEISDLIESKNNSL